MVIHKILIICFFFSFQTFLFHMVKIISWPLLPLDTYRYILWFYVELYCIVLACPWYNLVGSLCLDTPSFAVKQKWKWHIILDLFWLSPTWHTVDLIAHLQVKPPSVFFAAEYSPDPSPPLHQYVPEFPLRSAVMTKVYQVNWMMQCTVKVNPFF